MIASDIIIPCFYLAICSDIINNGIFNNPESKYRKRPAEELFASKKRLTPGVIITVHPSYQLLIDPISGFAGKMYNYSPLISISVYILSNFKCCSSRAEDHQRSVSLRPHASGMVLRHNTPASSLPARFRALSLLRSAVPGR